MKTTNYFNTLIEIADDCKAETATVPPLRGSNKSVANLQYEMLADHPYAYTSDDVLFAVHAERKQVADDRLADERARYFAKGQPCFRASPLTKRYGWGVHSDAQGKIALVLVDSETYRQLQADASVVKTKAMRSRRK